MDNIQHTEDCIFFKKKIVKTLNWWRYLGLKNCPECQAEVQ